MSQERAAPTRRRSRASFVVRVWDEPSTSAPGNRPEPGAELRGSVEPVSGGSVRYFASLDGLTGVIASSLGLAAMDADPGHADTGHADTGPAGTEGRT